MPAFHEVRFPVDIAIRSRGGPERRTEIVTLASGREERNARWANARRRYDAGYGVRSLGDLSAVIAFFEERRGRLYGFRFRDRTDYRSTANGAPPQAGDQVLGTGDGTRRDFPLVKTYGANFAPYQRPITKPVAGSVLVKVGPVPAVAGTDYDLDSATGIISFRVGKAPATGAVITAGFEFDVPVRFDTDRLEINLASFNAGDIPAIPLIEIGV